MKNEDIFRKYVFEVMKMWITLLAAVLAWLRDYQAVAQDVSTLLLLLGVISIHVISS